MARRVAVREVGLRLAPPQHALAARAREKLAQACGGGADDFAASHCWSASG